jgi:pimeloyl-ACP methyl ester carboxylesterase
MDISEHPSTAAAPTVSEPCPAPLEWRQVLTEFRAQRQSVVTRSGDIDITSLTFGYGRPLYFLGPAAGSHEQFALLAWLLREEFRCVFVEYRPLPAFTFRKCGMALAQQAADVTSMAQHLGDDQFAVCASSFGSLIALQLLADEPDSVNAAVLVGGAAHRDFTWLEQLLIDYGRFMPARLSSLPGWRSLQQHNHRPWFPPFDATRWEFLLNDLAATPTSQLARRLALSRRVDFRPLLPQIRTPVLVVRTEGEGKILTACQDELEAGLPHVRSEWMHTSGHFPHLTHPHRLAKLLKTFLLEPARSQ